MALPPPTSIERSDLQVYVDMPLPVPGSGNTAARWDALTAIARHDLALAKLVEPHHDAAAILIELGEKPPQPGEIWAVWAAEPPFAVLTAAKGHPGWQVTGRKAFCSGAAAVTHALVTAVAPDSSQLFAVELDAGGVRESSEDNEWVGWGMARAGTTTLTFEHVRAIPVGAPGAYVDRPGFWLGAIGIAACWYGGALGVADTLESAVSRLDGHGLALLGSVRADLDTLALAFEAAADRMDRDSADIALDERLAQSLRARTAAVVENVISCVGRALGPGPLAFDAGHAGRVADLQVFVRQHHAERDLERLGSIGRAHE